MSTTLDRTRLVTAAFSVLEDHGLAGLSTRRIAASLGVQAPAIYWHVSDKAELLGLMAREIYAQAYASAPISGSWQDWLRVFGGALRHSFASRRDGALLCAAAKPLTATSAAEQADKIARDLMMLGLDRPTAVSRQASVISYTLGWAMFEANGPMYDFLDQMLVFEDSFQDGLEAMIQGFSAKDAAGREPR